VSDTGSWFLEDVETGAPVPSYGWERHQGAATEGTTVMDWKLEVVVIPVTDVDRAKSFYLDKLGFRLDADTRPTETMRVVHMTPPGSACSVVIGPVVVAADDGAGPGGSMQLVVTDIEAARAELAGRGVETSEIQTLDPRDGGKFLFFSDPDGNNWAVQEIRERVGAELG
jgi:catechol 2,3-dioxygenase-like lactoylglutathione lyase family enzyme